MSLQYTKPLDNLKWNFGNHYHRLLCPSPWPNLHQAYIWPGKYPKAIRYLYHCKYFIWSNPNKIFTVVNVVAINVMV